MKTQKSDTITFRLNPALKRKFEVAKWFLHVSDILGLLVQDFVRDFEKQYWIIEVSLDKSSQYDIVTKMLWINITRTRFDELWELYPKDRKNKAVYGN